MKKFLVFLLLFIQSFFIGANAQTTAIAQPFRAKNNIQYCEHQNNPYSNGYIFVDFKTNETALLTINNMQEVISSCRENSPNICSGFNTSVSNNNYKIFLTSASQKDNVLNLNKKISFLSTEIYTRAP